MHNRIRQVMEWSGLNQRDFAVRMGISPSVISSIFKGRTAPTQNIVAAIHATFPEVNLYWLQFNEGEMLTAPVGSASPAPAAPQSASAAVADGFVLTAAPQSALAPTEGGASAPPVQENSAVSAPISTSMGADEPAPREAGTKPVRRLRGDVSNGHILTPEEVAALFGTSSMAAPAPQKRRKIVEIRVFFDDDTYESFTPRR